MPTTIRSSQPTLPYFRIPPVSSEATHHAYQCAYTSQANNLHAMHRKKQVFFVQCRFNQQMHTDAFGGIAENTPTCMRRYAHIWHSDHIQYSHMATQNRVDTQECPTRRLTLEILALKFSLASRARKRVKYTWWQKQIYETQTCMLYAANSASDSRTFDSRLCQCVCQCIHGR